MVITAVLLRWYRSFNVRTLGPADEIPQQAWHQFRSELLPFIRVPLDAWITTIVGANESGKSHLLSAIAKVVAGKAVAGPKADLYEIKDICRYCGFDALDDGVWPEIGLEVKVTPEEAALFATPAASNLTASNTSQPEVPSADFHTITVILNGADQSKFATVYLDDVVARHYSKDDWEQKASDYLPEVAILDANLALPNQGGMIECCG